MTLAPHRWEAIPGPPADRGKVPSQLRPRARGLTRESPCCDASVTETGITRSSIDFRGIAISRTVSHVNCDACGAIVSSIVADVHIVQADPSMVPMRS